MSDQQPMSVNAALAQRVQNEIGQNVYLCYQCVKCTSGCPVGEFFDWQPNQIMRALQLGQEDIALQAETPWLCASCQTCTTRCPQGLDIAAIMEFITREARARGIQSPVPAVNQFNEAFMREVRLWGRAYELGLMAEMKLRSHHFTEDMDLGIKMMQKRKLALLPKHVRPPRHVKPVPGAANAVAYYPGCSLHSTAREFDVSTQAVCAALDLELIEPDGWVCCGSSAAHRADPDEAVRLPLENLAIIEQSGFKEVTMPCAACFNRHKAAQYHIRHDEQHRAALNEAVGYEYRDTVQVNTLIDTLLQRVGTEQIAERVQHRLEGLRVVSYYGCLLTRPPDVTEAEHHENPTGMDDLLAALGADVRDWSYKTSCCGAAHSLTRQDIVIKLSSGLIEHAREVGAEAIAVACPLCHMNLDARQFQMELESPMPVLYFTQLMAVALGLPEKAAAFNRNLVDPRPLLREKGLLDFYQ
jgi:heterodisulfide reductase subunit B